MFFWNFFIRLILELYYPMLLVALVTLYTSEKPSKQVSQMIQVAILVGFVIFTFFFMRKHQNNVENKEFKDKFGAYMTNTRPTSDHRQCTSRSSSCSADSYSPSTSPSSRSIWSRRY
jgi:Ca2+/H+ antiporter